MFLSLYQTGVTKREIEISFDDFKIDNFMIELLLKCYEEGHELHILSGSNDFFVETVLDQNGLNDIFESIIANKATWEGDLLRISPCDKDGHDCNTEIISQYQFCDINICKGYFYFDHFVGF